MNKAIATAAFLVGAASLVSAQSWTDITTAFITAQNITTDYPGGCSGVGVNRLTGDVYVEIIGNGIWKSSNQGTAWTRIDQNTVSGRCETGVALTVDQDNPVRMASFSLDGDCGYTPDGTTWHKWTGMGRNWDFGSVDWGAANPLVMLAAKHEDGGKVYKTVDGGVSWTLLNITVNAQSNNNKSMIGVLNASTFVYCTGSGILRSTDAGTTWASVSNISARAKYPILFKGVHYVGTATGLLVSSDLGATWRIQGGAVEICQGPFFGADENTMMVVSSQGLHKTTNAGTTWTKVAALTTGCSGNTFDPLWFGGFSWDPVNNTAYATRMVCPTFKYAFPTTGVKPVEKHKQSGNIQRKVGMSPNGHLQVGTESGEKFGLTGKRFTNSIRR